MKNLLFLIIAVSLFSCKTSKIETAQNIESIIFYDMDENKISIQDLKQQWNLRIQSEEKVDAEIQTIQIMNVIDTATKKEKSVLIAYTDKKSSKTASELSPFKDGYKLSNRTITCTNCSTDLKIKVVNGDYYCDNNQKTNDTCTKISTAKVAEY